MSREPSTSPAPRSDLEERLAAVEERLGHRFRDRGLLVQALTHASCKSPDEPSNERLEFLGDAVLGLVVAHDLYTSYPDLEEGPLTRVRGAAVSARSLSGLARDLGLDQAVRLGKGLRREELSDAVLSNVLEAVLGALYLDGGTLAVRPVVLEGLEGSIQRELGAGGRNWKSLLQEQTQHERKVTPTYQVLEEHGPDHRKEFVAAAYVGGVELGRGRGPSKKTAEQAAAREALAALEAERTEGAIPPG